ncbi:MAG: hypothetical protein ABIQ91_00215 [Candidatus Paceibacterota bacterium]
MSNVSKARAWLRIKKVLTWVAYLIIALLAVWIYSMVYHYFKERAAAKKAEVDLVNKGQTKAVSRSKTSADSTREFQQQIRSLNDTIKSDKETIANYAARSARVDEYHTRLDSAYKVIDSLKALKAPVTVITKSAAPTVTKSAPVVVQQDTVKVNCKCPPPRQQRRKKHRTYSVSTRSSVWGTRW